MITTAILVSTPALRAERLAFPSGIGTSILEYGAIPDDGQDDTRAIRAALSDERTEDVDYYGRPKCLFFPAGTYNVSDTLSWRGCAVTVQGEGAGVTIIRLADATPLFGNSSAPRAVIRTPSGNMAFRHNFHDLTVNTGSGNPGAIGLDYISSNCGTVKNVSIVSEDRSGVAGLDMTRQWPGPLLIKNLTVTGFDCGIRVAHSEYGPTFENITLVNQNAAGIDNDGNILAIRNLSTSGTVPAIRNPVSWGYVIVLDSRFNGGGASISAIESGGLVYARNVTVDGAFQSVIRQKGAVVPGKTVGEYVSDSVYSLWEDAPKRSLGLAIAETPEYHDQDTARWGRYEGRWYGDMGVVQPAERSTM